MKLGLSGILTRSFITSPLTPLLLLAAVIVGLIALVALPREEEPQISVPMVDISVSANGYRAGEAVELVTRPLEDIVKDRPATVAFPGRVAVQGGLPIMYQGECVGAVGVSGAKSHEDEQVAAAGLKAIA